MYIPHFVYPSVDGHEACFYLLAIVNNAAVNIGVQVSVGVPAFDSLGRIYLGVKLIIKQFYV